MTWIADLVLAARILLAAVFGVAGVAKLLDLASVRQAASDFGVPPRLIGLVGVLLPVAEIAVGAALGYAPTAVGAAVAALVLLGLFMAGIVRLLARGQQPDCRCFGQVHRAPVGRDTLIRDAVLAVLALVAAVAGPGTGLSSWASGLSTLDWVTLGVAVVLAFGFVTEGAQLLERVRRRGSSAAPRSPGYPQGLSTGGDKSRRFSRGGRPGSSGR